MIVLPNKKKKSNVLRKAIKPYECYPMLNYANGKKTKKLYPKVLPFYIRLRFKLRAKNRILAETTKKKTYF